MYRKIHALQNVLLSFYGDTRTGFGLQHFTMEGCRYQKHYNELYIYLTKKKASEDQLNSGNESLRGKILHLLPCSFPLMIRVMVLKNPPVCLWPFSLVISMH